MVTHLEQFESGAHSSSLPLPWSIRFLLCGWMKSKRKVNTHEELLICILDVAAHMKKRKHQVWRTKHDFQIWVAECIAVDSAIFEHLLQTVTNLWFPCNWFVI